MKIKLPHEIQNGKGETLLFTELVTEDGVLKVLGENRVMPGSGPPLHVHWLQDEGFTVRSGTLGYQLEGGELRYAGPGESLVFKRGVAHRFWNAGNDILHCDAWVKPAHNFVYFLSAIFDAQQKSAAERPGLFDAAFLLVRYRSEFAMKEIPWTLRKIVFPFVYVLGHALGKYRKYRDAPVPVRE